MSTNTTLLQGSFVSTGGNTTIPLRCGVDWMRVYNLSEIGEAQIAALAVEFYWQQGFVPGDAIAYLKAGAGVQGANLIDVYGGVMTYVDSTLAVAGVINSTVTAVSAAAIPVVTNTGVNGLLPGDIVRMLAVTDADEIGGLDFTVGNNTLTNTTFSLDYMSQIVAGTDGSWMKIAYDALYYPRSRYITQITRAQFAVVTLSVTHGYKVGQLVRMMVPASFGMDQMNGLQATILAVDTTVTTGNTITLDIDSSSFSAFTFPITLEAPFTPAQVIPMGENTAIALAAGVNTLSDSTYNTGFIGMILTGGEGFPAGEDGDSIFWQAGTAFSNDTLPV